MFSTFSQYCALFVAKDVKSGQSPLMYAVESSNADMVHFLIEVNKNVWALNEDLWISSVQYELIQLLLLLNSCFVCPGPMLHNYLY